ncbi:hypothetical protein N7495_009315 [Penicillium taxi]|uniref:uncharacterized protein n=1 Tax=Penicillium taxi TaxID=168475 RepID=UPI002545308F|nr:uncharacterized protein N7495_009315 [Penicillium taxi]KAJ5884805.1 hypothetical protein N7495_009315 [Penicillium taxi]
MTAVTAVTKTKRRESLVTIGMPAYSQSRPLPASGRGSKKEGRTTRLSATQQGLEEITSNDSKRKADYDEDSDGFLFTRVPQKKSKPSVDPALEKLQSESENAPPKSTPRRGRPKKQKVGDSATPSTETVRGLPTRSTKGAGNTGNAESVSKSANTARSLPTHDTTPDAPPKNKSKRGRPHKRPSDANGVTPQRPEGTKIALPPADTPVIERNKELRGAKGKGRRRSSVAMRGRRASSLIDSGTSNALPHREVGTADFYKHIADEGLPEPRRMRQLLIWCATRALGNKPAVADAEDQSSRLAARVIQEELLNEFSSNADLSNWFNREDVNPPKVVVKKPNPRNVQNTDKIKQLEEQIQKLQKEKQSLNALLKQPAIPPITEPDLQDSTKSKQPRKSSPDHINPSLLDPSQHHILASLQPSASISEGDSSIRPPMSPSTVSARLSKTTSKLAPTLDTFADGIHDIELYRSTADAVSSRILRICAERLEERDAQRQLQLLSMESEDSDQQVRTIRKERPREDIGLILGALSRVERR